MMLHIRLRVAAPLIVGVLALGSHLHAQRSEAQVKSDIAFARGLAVRFQFVDLSEEVIASLEKERLSKELTEELGLAKCDVYYQGAKNEGDKEKRLQLYDKAMGAYQEFIDANPFSDFLPQAERSFVDLCNAYSSVMERALGEALGDEAEALRNKIRDVLQVGLDRTADALESFPDEPSPDEDRERKRLLLNRAQMLITFAKASEEGTFLFNQADKILESLAMEDEQSGWGLNAYLLLAKSKIAQGEYYDATAFDEFVVNRMVPYTADDRDLLEWDTIPMDFKEKRWNLVERATGDLLLSYMALGNVPEACKWALHYYNSWKRDGFSLSPIGYLSLLEVGRTLVNSGGYVGGTPANADLQWFESEEEMNKAGFSTRRNTRTAVDLALAIAQQVNDDNKGNVLQVYAQKLISEIRDLPGVVLAPDVLFEAAQGEYNAGHYREAYDALKGVIRALDAQDEATRRTYMAGILYYMGRSLGRMDRPLEAAMVYRDAVSTWGGDLDYDPKNANGYYKSIGVVRSRNKGDARINKMWLEAEQIVVRMDDKDTDTIKWRQAERSYSNKDYETARGKYLDLGTASDHYEQAMVKAALCLQKMGDNAGAIAGYKQYLEVFVPDPQNILKKEAKIAARKMAMAQATYNLGRLAYKALDYETVVATYANFTKEFPDQDSYGPNAVFMRLMAHLALKKIPEAKADLAILLEKYPDQRATGNGALQIYNVLKAEQQAAEEAGEAERALALKREMAETIHVSNSLAKTPPFQNLRTETTLWIGIEEWEKGEAAARATLKAYEAAPAHEKSVRKFVLPDLGLCLLRQKRAAEAFEVLDPLIPDPDDDADPRKPSAETAANWCRAVCGWLEGTAQDIVEVPGVGGAENLEKASKLWLKLEKREAQDNKYECSWYGLKFELLYCWYQWSLVDSARKAQCKEYVTSFREVVDSSFSDVATKCGDDVLQKRFLWLLNKVR